MKAENARNGVRSFESVNHGTDDIREAATENENKHGQVGRCEVGNVDDGNQPEDEIQRHVGPAWSAEPGNPEHDSQSGADPDAEEEPETLLWREGENAEGRVGAGDEDKNVGVVEASENRLDRGRPVDSVIGGRDAEQQQRRQDKDETAPRGRHSIGEGDENHSTDDGDG